MEGRTSKLVIKEDDGEALAGAEDERKQDAGRKKERTKRPGGQARVMMAVVVVLGWWP